MKDLTVDFLSLGGAFRATNGVSFHVDAGETLFYLYAADLKSLRAELLARGVQAGEIAYPDYLPNGEFRVTDPDGYTLMIAQSAPDTP